jgi:large subunit ribosomal protein L13
MKQQKSYYPKQGDITKKWELIDAKGKTLGRIASDIAYILKGKHKAEYTPSVDVGDYVVVINAENVFVSGNKENSKIYYRHTGYPGGLKEKVYKDLKKDKPCEILSKAIWGMLPHNRLGRKLMKKVKIYSGNKHPHKAQVELGKET